MNQRPLKGPLKRTIFNRSAATLVKLTQPACGRLQRNHEMLKPLKTAPSKTSAVATPAVSVKRRAGTLRLPVGTAQPAPVELPHERDESSNMTDGIPSPPVQQAYRDVKRGLQDTDRGAEAGRTYQKLKR